MATFSFDLMSSKQVYVLASRKYSTQSSKEQN